MYRVILQINVILTNMNTAFMLNSYSLRLQVQNLPVPVIPPVQQALPPVQPVPTQNQGVQAEPVVANGENLLNMPCTNDTHTPMLMAFSIYESISPHRYVFNVLFCRFVDGLKY
jgi:hypothetical protein